MCMVWTLGETSQWSRDVILMQVCHLSMSTLKMLWQGDSESPSSAPCPVLGVSEFCCCWKAIVMRLHKHVGICILIIDPHYDVIKSDRRPLLRYRHVTAQLYKNGYIRKKVESKLRVAIKGGGPNRRRSTNQNPPRLISLRLEGVREVSGGGGTRWFVPDAPSFARHSRA